MIGAHSLIYGRPEPHLLTPLAHLGYYAKVDKAPYDAVLAAEAAARVRRRSAARRAGLHRRLPRLLRHALPCACWPPSRTSGSSSTRRRPTPWCSTSSPASTRRAKYVVLTRHPLAVFSSYAESFFNGDYAAAQAYNPILERYVPALANVPARAAGADLPRRLRAAGRRPRAHARPRSSPSSACPNEPQAVEYGRHEPAAQGLGDPDRREEALAADDRVGRQVGGRDRHATPDRLQLCQQIIARLDPADLAAVGPSARRRCGSRSKPPAPPARHAARKALDRYRLERLLIVKLRALVQRRPLLRRWLGTVRLGADVLLRE